MTIVIMTVQLSAQFLTIDATMPQSDHKIKNVHGKETSLGESKKLNGLLVIFSCNSCPIVQKYQYRTELLCKYAASNSVGVIVLNSCERQRDKEESLDAMKKHAKTRGYTFDYCLDHQSRIADAFGAIRTPEVYLFNKENKLIYKGGIDENAEEEESGREHARIAIMEMVSGKEVFKNSTRSIGCPIRRIKKFD